MGASVTKELLETLAKAIVDEPDQVRVDVVEGERAEILQLHVAPDDMGKVIGRRGRIATALRTLVKAAATRDDRHVIVEIMD